MTIKTFARRATLLAALAAPLAASADEDKSGGMTDKSGEMKDKSAKTKLTDNEIQLISHLHHLNQMEIEAGKMAEKQGGTAAVKSYGQTLVRDHTTADKDLTAFAKKHGLATIPKDTPTNEAEQKEQKDDQEAIARLKTLKGADFDRAFLPLMASNHDREIVKLDTVLGMVQDPDLSTMLKDNVRPTLQKHADMAKDLQKQNAQAAR